MKAIADAACERFYSTHGLASTQVDFQGQDCIKEITIITRFKPKFLFVVLIHHQEIFIKGHHTGFHSVIYDCQTDDDSWEDGYATGLETQSSYSGINITSPYPDNVVRMELFIPEMKNIEKMRLFDMSLYRDGAYNLNLFQWDEFDGADYGEEFQVRFQIEVYTVL